MSAGEKLTPYTTMKTVIQLYDNLKQVVKFFYKQLRLDKFEKNKGRKLAIKIPDTISLAIFKQSNNIATKKSIYKIFKPKRSYKTLVVNINRFAHLALLILTTILKVNRSNQRFIKHTDSTDIPVCSMRRAKFHKTMQGLASWANNGKGFFFGLKMHITADLNRQLLAVKFTSGNVDDRAVFLELNKDLLGLFIADAGYVSEKLQRDFYIKDKRLLLTKPRNNMRKIMTKFQEFLYGTRMLIELNFRNLKMFYGLITSLPRSAGRYLTNYIYALLAYQIA
jgi:hypothetical protein